MTIVALPDVHAPFHSKAAITIALEKIKKLKPDVVIQLGDLYDMYAMARFPRSHNLMTPAEEIVEARIVGEELWKLVKRAAPKARRIQILGNHGTLRIQNKIFSQAPELESLVNYKQLWEFDGVETQDDFRNPLIIEHPIHGEIALMHGFLSGAGAHVRHAQMNVVHGHLHSAWVHWHKVQGRGFFELNCGHLGDPETKAMSYTKSRWTKWHLGFGLIDDFGPKFVNLEAEVHAKLREE